MRARRALLLTCRITLCFDWRKVHRQVSCCCCCTAAGFLPVLLLLLLLLAVAVMRGSLAAIM
jgi:hypothetical protein